ncbi:MAG: type II toxin-antitoxin system HicB family antitoxin [Dehalococcoidia bacterium]
MEYLLVIHSAEEGGYWAEVPALPGCFTQGETLDELLAEARDAISSHIEALREDGQAIPEEQIVIATVHLPEPSAA